MAKKIPPGTTNKQLSLWTALFPSTFFIWGTNPKPLAINIHRDLKIQFPDLHISQIRVTLHRYTKTRQYLECLIEGTPRINLTGDPCGEVMASEAEHANELLAERRSSKIAA
jgi:ProP effector